MSSSIGHAAAGSVGTAISTLVTYPLDLVNTRLKVQRQLQDDKTGGPRYESIADAFRTIYAREGGVTAFFAGLTTDLVKSAVDSFLFFLFYSYLRVRLRQRQRRLGVQRRSLSPLQELAVGAVAGACARFFTTPIANVVTRRQTAGVGNDGPQGRDASFWDSVAEIQREKGGVQGLWAGYSASLVLTLNPSITFFLQDTLATAVAGADLDDDAGPGFLVAAVSKVVATAITYPFQAAKARVQVAPAPPPQEKGQSDSRSAADTVTETAEQGPTGENTSEALSASTALEKAHSLVQDNIFATVLRIARVEGAGALYDGLSGELLKAFFSHGIAMFSKDIAHKLIVRFYLKLIAQLRQYPEVRSRWARACGNLSKQITGHLRTSS